MRSLGERNKHKLITLLTQQNEILIALTSAHIHRADKKIKALKESAG